MQVQVDGHWAVARSYIRTRAMAVPGDLHAARCTLHAAHCTVYTVPLQYRPPSGHSTSGTGGEVRVDNDSEQEQEPGHGAGGGQVGRVPGRLAVGGGQEEAARADRAQGAGGGGDCFQTCFSSLQWPTSCPAPALTHPPHYHSLLPRGARHVQEGTTLRSDHCPLPAAPCSCTPPSTSWRAPRLAPARPPPSSSPSSTGSLIPGPTPAAPATLNSSKF